MNGRAPLPFALIGLGGAIGLAGAEHPLLVGSGAIGAALLLRAAPRSAPRLALWSAAAVAAGLLLLTPFVSSDGQTELISGPPIAVVDTVVTAEELLWGLVVAARLAGIVLLILAVLAWIDRDRAQDLLGRALPRSALMVALAGRMLPALEADAALVARSARLRGVDLDRGGRLTRARRAAPLVLPLAATALERGVDRAEALVARGYGGPGATRLPEPPLTAGERAALGCGLLLMVLGAVIAVGSIGDFRFFPSPASPGGAPALVASAALMAALVLPALALRRAER